MTYQYRISNATVVARRDADTPRGAHPQTRLLSLILDNALEPVPFEAQRFYLPYPTGAVLGPLLELNGVILTLTLPE